MGWRKKNLTRWMMNWIKDLFPQQSWPPAGDVAVGSPPYHSGCVAFIIHGGTRF